MCRRVTIQGREAILPLFLRPGGWSLAGRGYLKNTSRGKLYKRGAYAHRVVMAKLLGRKLEPDEVVHHQDHNKLNCCPSNLILMPAVLNPRVGYRCPYTGRYLSPEALRRRLGLEYQPPDWVTRET